MSKPAFKVTIDKSAKLRPKTRRLAEFIIAKAFEENRCLEKAVWKRISDLMKYGS